MLPSWPTDFAFASAGGETWPISEPCCCGMSQQSDFSTLHSNFNEPSTDLHPEYQLGEFCRSEIASNLRISELTLNETNSSLQFGFSDAYSSHQGARDDCGAWRHTNPLPRPARPLSYSFDELGSQSPPISPTWSDYHSSDDAYSVDLEYQSPNGPNLYYSTLECDKVPIGALFAKKSYSTQRKRRRPLTGLLRHSAKIRALPTEIQQKGSMNKSKRLADIPNYKTFKLSKTASVGLVEVLPTPYIESNEPNIIQKEWVFMDGINTTNQSAIDSNS